MYVQIKTACGIKYVYIVESYRKDNGTISHRIIKSLGRYDDLIKSDPNAIEVLKEQVKSSSYEFKANHVIERMKSVFTKSQLKRDDDLDFISGFPHLNFSNYFLRHIWRERLRLDYKLKYIQDRYCKDVAYSLSNVLFYKVLFDIAKFDYDSEDFGVDIGFLGIDFDKKAQDCAFDSLKKYIFLNINSIYSHVYERMESRPISSHLAMHLNEDFLFDKDSDNPDSKDFNLDSIDINTIDKYVDRLITNISYVIYLMINCKLASVVKGLSVSKDDIGKSFRQAELLIEYSFVESFRFIFTKAYNGKYVQLMNYMMKAFDLIPLINAQDRHELARCFKSKFSSDHKVIPSTIYNLITKRQYKVARR